MPPILIADNDRQVSSLLGEVLSRAGMQVVHAYDGHEALVIAPERAVRVMICDIDMPRVSGHDVLAEMARWPSPPATLVISGYVDGAIEQRLRQFGFVRGIWRKPFDLVALASAVRELATAADRSIGLGVGQPGTAATACEP